MNWNLKCRRVERMLALQAGNDLDEAGQLVAERHVAVCPRCRERWQALQVAHSALDVMLASPVKFGMEVVSVWPDVRRQIRILESDVQAANWRNWLPSGALAAACLALAVLLVSDSGMTGDGAPSIRLPLDSLPIGTRQAGRFNQGGWKEKFDPDDRRPVRYLLDGTDVSRL